MKTIKYEMSDWALEDIKRLIAEATQDSEGQMPVVRDNRWPYWIGAAVSHLRDVVEAAEPVRRKK